VAAAAEERGLSSILGAPGFADQVPVEFPVANYLLTLPSAHPLREVLDPQSPRHQPYREAGLIRLAQALGTLNRQGTAIDIGANVGDSCAIIHRLSALRILSVEASDFFFPYLQRNVARHFAARATVRHAFVLPRAGGALPALYHQGGTAHAIDQPATENIPGIGMADLQTLAGDIALLKIDVDGQDMALVAAALERQPRYPIYFEMELMGRTLDSVRATGAQARELFAQAAGCGYARAYLWDDRGRFYGRIETADRGTLANALNYMGHFSDRPVWGFDICLLHQDDGALAAELERGLAVNAVAPLP